MAQKGKIREDEIIDKDVYSIGEKYAKGLDPAIEANKLWLKSFDEIKASAKSYNDVEKQFKVAKGRKEFLQLKEKEVILYKKTLDAQKAEQSAALQAQRVESEKVRTQKQIIDLENKKITLTNKQEAAQRRKTKLTAEERLELQLLNRNAKEAATLSSRLATAYEKQSVVLTKLRREYKNVALTEGEASVKAKRLRNEILKLDTALKGVDANVGQFQRSVGNYGKAMQSAAGAARNMVAAMGVASGAFLFVRVVSDAFKRVREFDKSMQNLAGVMRTSRKELAGVEDAIIDVAGASIKTSNEVANLAESLATLGKSKEEIIDLLEPVNNLAIGLETTSEEAAEFLVQTLNAFGAGSEEAGKYADVIATIRTSTTLDFQKMRDSFQYLTPISRILNKDLAYTGSVLGILTDNGLKAEQAGRLLGTAQQKLAKENKSLAEALNEINEARAKGIEGVDLLAKASDLFGKQAAKVGIILAENTEVIEENAQAIRENGGALDDLVDEQLKSIDAQLRITTSIWEKFVLSIENGQGGISKALSGLLTGVNYLLESFIYLNSTNDEIQEKFGKKVNNKFFEEVTDAYLEAGEAADKLAIKDLERTDDAIDNIQKEIASLKLQKQAIEDARDGTFGKGVRKSANYLTFGLVGDKPKELDEIDEKIKNLNVTLSRNLGINKAAELQLGLNSKESKTKTENTEEETKATKELTDAEKKLIEQREKQLKKDAFNLKQSQLKAEIDANEEILKDEESTLVEKQLANINYYEAKRQLIDNQKDYEVAQNKGRADKIKQIEFEYDNELNAIQEQRKDNGIKFIGQQFKDEIKAIKEAQKAKQDALNAEIGTAQQTLSNSGQTPQDVEAYEKTVSDIKKKYALLTVQAQIDAIKLLQQDKTFTVEQQAQLAEQLSNLEIQYDNIATDQIIKNNEDKLKSEEEAFAARQAIIGNFANQLGQSLGIDSQSIGFLMTQVVEDFDDSTQGILNSIGAAATVTQDILNGVFENNIENIQSQINQSEDYYNRQYELAEGDKLQQDLIREEQEKKREILEKKIRKEKEKQAKANKTSALFQAGINTALAVTAALATVPFVPLGLTMSILAGALGAVQIAAIASKPIPKFKDGHLSGTHEGWALTNDGGRDEVWERNGKAQVIKGRNVPIQMQKGDKIYKSVDDYKDLMRASILSSVDIHNNNLEKYNAEQSVIDNIELIEEVKGMRKDLQKKAPTYINMPKIDIEHAIWGQKNIKWD
ncbi:MAG: phage tail tape measure protein [Flavobacteriaceae bacterium]